MNRVIKKFILIGIVVIGIINLFFILQARQRQAVTHPEILQTNLIEVPMQRENQIILRLANNHRPDYPTSIACDYFSQLVEERTDGKIKILNYHAGMLGDEKTSVSQVIYGGIDIARVSIALLADYDPELIALQMPYLYKDSEHMWTVLNSDIGDRFLEGMDEIGVEGLCWYDAGARNFYLVDKKVTSVKDLQGMQIRVQESSFMADLIDSLGAVPVEIPFDKVGNALRRNEIDGAENNFSSYISTKHYIYAKNIVLDEHSRIPEVIIINNAVMESLTEEEQNIIRGAARDSAVRQRELWELKESQNREMLEAKGTVITEMKDKGEFIEKVQPVYDKYGEEYKEIFKEIEQLGNCNMSQ